MSKDDCRPLADAMDVSRDSGKHGSDSDTDSDSSLDNDSVSGLDVGECDYRRLECLADMRDLERQFHELRDKLFHERMMQVDRKLDEVRSERAYEYQTQVQKLREDMRIQSEVAGILRDLRYEAIHIKFESEEDAAKRNHDNEKNMLKDTIEQELKMKIYSLEEDRQNADLTDSSLWCEKHAKKPKKKEKPSAERRKKPVIVTGPYIVYQLDENEILEDWCIIKKQLEKFKVKCKSSQKRRSECI